MESGPSNPAGGNFNLPEWETSSHHKRQNISAATQGSFKDRALGHFNRLMPPHRSYFGAAVASLLLLALIIGLAAGLSPHSSYAISSLRLLGFVLTYQREYKHLPLGSATYTGDLTYYGPGLGACGVTSSDNDDIVSVSHIIFDAESKSSDPNANPLCRHKIRAVRGGNSVDLTVVDRCEFWHHYFPPAGGSIDSCR